MTNPDKLNSFRALALQVTCYAVNQASDRQEAGLMMQNTINRLAQQIAASIAFIARNPWLIYSAAKNFDPSEISLVYGEEGQLPPVRSYGFNVSFTF